MASDLCVIVKAPKVPDVSVKYGLSVRYTLTISNEAQCVIAQLDRI